jgi:putative two-component system response regulator
VAINNIAQFRALVGQVQQASEPEIKLALTRLAAEARQRLYASSPEAADFFETLRHSLSLLRGPANAELRVNCLLDCANYFYVADDAEKGIRAAREGLALATAVNHVALVRKSYTFLGNLLADVGVLAEAIEAYVAAIEHSTRLGDLEGQAKTMMNLGVALFYAGQHQDALSCLERTEVLIEGSSFQASLRPSVLVNKALCYLHLDQIEKALTCSRRAVQESGPPKSGPEVLARIIRECTYVQVLLEAQQVRTAASRLDHIRGYSLRAQSQKALVMSAIAEGLVAVAHGDVDSGLNLLKDAHARAGDVNSLLQDSLIALVKGYEQVGQHSNALGFLQKLMDRVRKAGEQCVLIYLRTGGSLFGGDRTDRSHDLRALQHREALLRAKVAEDQLLWSQIEMLERLAVTADLREEATGEHGYRVGRLSAALAEELGWGAEACLALDLAARLHDIGKIGVPDRILLTSQELKEAERHFMCTHTVIGSELLAKSNIAQLRMAEEIALSHHECWDGSGYPRKLKAKKIPIHARIVALADVFDALTHGRPYAAPWSMDRALEEISNRRGTQFDPDLTDRFLLLIERLRAEHENLDEFLGRAGRNSPFLQARRKIKVMLEQERENERRVTVPGNQTRH